MNLAAVSIGANAPFEVNVVIEVPIGGEPIKYEMDKASGALEGRSLPLYLDALSRQLRLHPAHPVGRRRPLRRHRRQHPRHHSRRVHGVQNRRRAADGGRSGRRRKAAGGALRQAYPALRRRRQLHRPAEDHASADRAFLRPLQGSRARTNGSRFSAGATPRRRAGWSAKASPARRRRGRREEKRRL